MERKLTPFVEFISESYVNMIHGHPGHEEEMHKHKHEVHALLIKAYEKIGGIHGRGFASPDDMVKHIPMWKLHKHEGKVVAAKLYKNKNGRKSVAIATDGSHHGKKALGRIIHDEMTHKRSWGEQSGSALSFTKRVLGDHEFNKQVIPYHEAKKLHDDEIRPAPHDDPEVERHPEHKDNFYQRRIQGSWHTKLSVGHPHGKIT